MYYYYIPDTRTGNARTLFTRPDPKKILQCSFTRHGAEKILQCCFVRLESAAVRYFHLQNESLL
jgi:hypothetical protein